MHVLCVCCVCMLCVCVVCVLYVCVCVLCVFYVCIYHGAIVYICFLPHPVHRSIGATVVEMLKCHPPWYEYEPTAAMFKIVTEDTRPNLPPHCSEYAEHFLRLCFIK